MPNYEYLCRHCGTRSTLRRSFSEWDDPAECLTCGTALNRQFSPNANIHIPIHFQSVRQGGVEGNYSFSDFHGDTTEKELAHIKHRAGRNVEVIPTKEFLSMSGAGKGKPKEAREAEIETGLSKAYDKARDTLGPPPPED